jgi:hypothetical protein
MTPYETWKKNKGRVDLRKYTREFQKNFETKKSFVTLPTKIYAITYKPDAMFETDKHHITPIILSFGRFKDDEGASYLRGVNLLYLRNEQSIELMQEVFTLHKFPIESRIKRSIQIHDKWMAIVPFAFKNFEERRITSTSEINEADWGMIPLLHKFLWGNFNAQSLDESFQVENKKRPLRERKKEVKMEKPVEDDEQKVEESFSEGGIDSSFFNDDI